MLKFEVSARAKANGPKLLVALGRLLAFPRNQDSTDLKGLTAIAEAQRLVHRVRRGPDF